MQRPFIGLFVVLFLPLTAASQQLLSKGIADLPPATTINPGDYLPICQIHPCPTGTQFNYATIRQISSNLLAWGLDNTGTTDSSAAFQAVLNYACSTADYEIFIPAGVYNIHDVTVSCPVIIRGNGRRATTINYSAATNFGIQFAVSGFPNFKYGSWVEGGSIQDIGFTRSTGNTWALEIFGYRDFVAKNLLFNTPYNGIWSFANQNITEVNINFQGTINNDILFYGDISGLNSSGNACTISTADCSTRTDVINIGVIYAMDNTQTNTCVAIKGYIATINSLGAIGCEGSNIGLQVTCQTGLDPQLSQCPHYVFLDNFQTEFWKTAGLFFQDTVNVKMEKVYSYGAFVTGANNALSISTLNYGNSTGCSGTQCFPPGTMKFYYSQFFSTQQDCILVQAVPNTLMTDINFYGNDINGCNGGNGGYGAINIAPSGGSISQGHIANNTLCAVGGYSSSSIQAYGIKYGTNAAQFTGNGNSYFSCAVGVINNSAYAHSNYDFAANPPPGFGSVSETDRKRTARKRPTSTRTLQKDKD